jgi:hypothetical protein
MAGLDGADERPHAAAVISEPITAATHSSRTFI